MKGASKVLMGTTLAIAIALSIVLIFVLVLLVELYCSLLFNRRRKTLPNITNDNTVTLPAPGVLLNAPRSIFYPIENNNNNDNNNSNNLDLENNQKQILESPKEHLVYICNPMYDNEHTCHTPYETPESSPSRLYSDEEEEMEIMEYVYVCIDSPELKPMEKLQAEACSVSLRDASSLATSPSGSDTNTNNGVSTTVSGSPSTSW